MLKTSFEDSTFQIPQSDAQDFTKPLFSESSNSGRSTIRTPEFKKGASPLTSAFKSQLAPLQVKDGRETPRLSIEKPMGVFTKYNKYTIFWASARENDETYEITVELPSFCTVFDAKKVAIETFNILLQEKKKEFCLHYNYELFEMYFAKKNGRPKLDYPSLLPEQVLSEVGINLLCLKEKSEEAIVNQKHINIRGIEESGSTFVRSGQKTPLLDTQTSELSSFKGMDMDAKEQAKEPAKEQEADMEPRPCCWSWTQCLFGRKTAKRKYEFGGDKAEPLLPH
eukprot:TRINITY_DN5869_c0_g1_i6.p1 TRINITY_DN5869_c0_g1~~TRINITY_DN5869_c0_g1_i6.p1  ORF type:complete len:282 (-),score=60.06 TRINITY_DN5869_c0_g1_i6:104-949(-)